MNLLDSFLFCCRFIFRVGEDPWQNDASWSSNQVRFEMDLLPRSVQSSNCCSILRSSSPPPPSSPPSHYPYQHNCPLFCRPTVDEIFSDTSMWKAHFKYTIHRTYHTTVGVTSINFVDCGPVIWTSSNCRLDWSPSSAVWHTEEYWQ